MKKTIIFAIIGLLVIAGVIFYISKDNQPTSPSAEEEAVRLDEYGTPAQGKLNIDEVCEGALAYMSFEDGESADKFVAECKAGEHPEIIERYKAEMNVGEEAAI